MRMPAGLVTSLQVKDARNWQSTYSAPPPQPSMEECGVLLQIKLKPQKHLGSLRLSTAKEHGSSLRLQNTRNMNTSHTNTELVFFLRLLLNKLFIICLSTVFTDGKYNSQGRSGNCTGLETLTCSKSPSHLKLKSQNLGRLPMNTKRVSRDCKEKKKGKKKKKLETHSPPLMIPTTGIIQAADIISNSMDQKPMGNSIESHTPSASWLKCSFTMINQCTTEYTFQPPVSPQFPQQSSGSSQKQRMLSVLPTK